MGSMMRRTSSVLTTVSRPDSAGSKDADSASLSGSTKSREAATLSSPPPPPVVSTPSPIAESPLREAAATVQEIAGPSPLALPIASPEAVPPTLPPPVEELQSPTGYIPPPVIDSSVGNPGAFTDEVDKLPQPDIAQDPHAVVPVEPQVESVTVDAIGPAPAVVESADKHEPEPEATVTEALVEEPTSYFDGPMSESIKDFVLDDHADNTTAVSKAVHENAKALSPESVDAHGEVILATGEVVRESANIVLPEAAEAHHDDHVIPLTTETERQEETQQKTEPIAIPVVSSYDLPSYPMNLGSGQEVWGGEHDYGREGLHRPYEGAYSSSSPIIIPSSENLKRVERNQALNRFVDLF